MPGLCKLGHQLIASLRPITQLLKTMTSRPLGVGQCCS
jgi:hypothetical protein